MAKTNLLTIKDLIVTVNEVGGQKILVNKINLEVSRLSITALVGGSGSGKTTTGLAILRLLPQGLNVVDGKIWFDGKFLLDSSEKEMRQVRGKEIGMIFQEPLNAFNPVFSIGNQIEEVLVFHTNLNRQKRRERVCDLLDLVGLPDPKRMMENYPHQLSGGMRQRAMIAQTIAADPKLIIADEPTSNLDVTLQAKIIELFKKLKKQLKLSILLITHDLGMVAHMADQVAVMNEGEIVEQGLTQDVLNFPKAEYTNRLVNCSLMER